LRPKRKRRRRKHYSKKPRDDWTRADYVKACDEAASEIVRAFVGKCEICGATKALQHAHILSRGHEQYRWYWDNALCLCYGCHLGHNRYSAHQSPIAFASWLQQNRPEKYRLAMERQHEYERAMAAGELTKPQKLTIVELAVVYDDLCGIRDEVRVYRWTCRFLGLPLATETQRAQT